LFDIIADDTISQGSAHKNCKAGDRAFTLAPDGRIYVCSAHYTNEPERSVGDIHYGIANIKNPQLFKAEYQPICSVCDVYQCTNCIYLNEKTTLEVNVPPSFQCRKSQIEKAVANEFIKVTYPDTAYTEVVYNDPIATIIGDFRQAPQKTVGYYTFKL
jgi:CXXX repeat peptide maturase